MKILNSGLDNPCPVCGRTKDTDCGWADDKSFVLCHTPLNINSEVTQPPDIINGYRKSDKINNSGYCDRVYYFKNNQEKVAKQLQYYLDINTALTGNANSELIDDSNIKAVLARRCGANVEDLSNLIKYNYSATQHTLRGDLLEGKKIILPAYLEGDRRIYKMGDNPWPLYNEENAKHQPSNFLILVEGEKCVEIARSQFKIEAVTLQGSRWSKDYNKVINLAASLQRSILFLADNDQPGIKKANGLEKAAKALDYQDRVFIINCAELSGDIASFPNGGDLAELVSEDIDTYDKLRERINNVLSQKQPTKSQKQQVEESYQQALQQASDTPNLANKSVFSEAIALLREQADQRKPKADIVGGAIAQLKAGFWAFDATHNTWAIYNDLGIWEHQDDLKMRAFINDILKDNDIKGYGASSFISNVLEKIKLELINYAFDADSTKIAFSDGVLDTVTKQITQHSPKNFLLWQLPHPYQDAGDWQKINAFLTDLTCGEKRYKEVLIAFAAALLKRRSDLQKFLYLVGRGGSGKSTFLNLLIELVGSQNASSANLHSLTENTLSDFIGKPFVVFPDQSSIKQLDIFKQLTGNDFVRARRLYKDGVSFQFKGLIAVSSNDPIFVGRGSHGEWFDRRVILIPCNAKVSKKRKNSGLLDELKTELPAFINYLLNIPDTFIEKILKDDFNHYSHPSFGVSSSQWDQLCLSSSLAGFINDMLVIDPLNWVAIGRNKNQYESIENVGDTHYNQVSGDPTLYGAYAVYCRSTGRSDQISLQRFSHDLYTMLSQTLNQNIEKGRLPNTANLGLRGVRIRSKTELTERLHTLIINSENTNVSVLDVPESTVSLEDTEKKLTEKEASELAAICNYHWKNGNLEAFVTTYNTVSRSLDRLLAHRIFQFLPQDCQDFIMSKAKAKNLLDMEKHDKND